MTYVHTKLLLREKKSNIPLFYKFGLCKAVPDPESVLFGLTVGGSSVICEVLSDISGTISFIQENVPNDH